MSETSQTPAMREADFVRISTLAYEYCGLDLHAGKQGLVAARLGKRIRELGLTSFDQYYEHVVCDKTGVGVDRDGRCADHQSHQLLS